MISTLRATGRAEVGLSIEEVVGNFSFTDKTGYPSEGGT